MIKISEYAPIKSGGSVRKRGSTSSASFSDILDAARSSLVDSAPAAMDVSATTALNNLLSLQEISEEDVQRRKLIQQGSNMLESLEDLRRDLLMGSVPANRLRDISRQLSVKKQLVTDPRLNDIIEEIELRTAVELAKLEKAIKMRE